MCVCVCVSAWAHFSSFYRANTHDIYFIRNILSCCWIFRGQNDRKEKGFDSQFFTFSTLWIEHVYILYSTHRWNVHDCMKWIHFFFASKIPFGVHYVFGFTSSILWFLHLYKFFTHFMTIRRSKHFDKKKKKNRFCCSRTIDYNSELTVKINSESSLS